MQISVRHLSTVGVLVAPLALASPVAAMASRRPATPGPVAHAAAQAPDASELPEEFKGSYKGTIATTAGYDPDGTLDFSADTITLQVADLVFKRGAGSTTYALVAGKPTISDTGLQSPATVFDCPCTDTAMLDPASPPGPLGSLGTGQSFTVTPAAGSDSWDGASTFDVGVEIEGIERDVTQSGTTDVGDDQDIAPKAGEGPSIHIVPVKLRLNPDGDYSLQFDTTVTDPEPPGGGGDAKTETDSGLLIGIPAGGGGAPQVTAPAVSGGSLKLSFGLSAPGSAKLTLEHRLGGRWVSVGNVSRSVKKGKNTLSLRGLFGASKLRKPGSYRVLLKVADDGHSSPRQTVGFTVH